LGTWKGLATTQSRDNDDANTVMELLSEKFDFGSDSIKGNLIFVYLHFEIYKIVTKEYCQRGKHTY